MNPRRSRRTLGYETNDTRKAAAISLAARLTTYRPKATSTTPARTPRIRGLYASLDRRFMMVMLIGGRYRCDWCGADLDLAFADYATFEVITQHGDVDVRIIIVGGEEHHRCERSATAE
jgi:hypothetical protein